jgi:RNA polymerase sigma-70 factor (ECF subfamily)
MSNKNEINNTINIGKEERTNLIKASMKGDRDAFEALFIEFSGYILNFVTNMAFNREDAEDIAQEVVVQAYISIDKLKHHYAFTSWLRSLMVNVTYSYNRKFGRTDTTVIQDEVLNEIPDGDKDIKPEDSILHGEEVESTREKMGRLIGKLPTAQRQALYLYYHEELSYKEIAKILGVKTATVGTNIMKAKKKLKSHIMDEEDSNKAFGAMIATAFAEEATTNSGATGALVAKIKSVDELSKTPLLNDASMMDISKSGKGLTALSKAIIGLAAASVVAVGGFVAVESTKDHPAPKLPPKEVTYTYEASQASIDFTESDSDISGENVNPASATIHIGDSVGKAKVWEVINDAGEVVAQGTGHTSNIPQNLRNGKYEVNWNVSSPEGAISVVHREFFIEQ